MRNSSPSSIEASVFGPPPPWFVVRLRYAFLAITASGFNPGLAPEWFRLNRVLIFDWISSLSREAGRARTPSRVEGSSVNPAGPSLAAICNSIEPVRSPRSISMLVSVAVKSVPCCNRPALGEPAISAGEVERDGAVPGRWSRRFDSVLSAVTSPSSLDGSCCESLVVERVLPLSIEGRCVTAERSVSLPAVGAWLERMRPVSS